MISRKILTEIFQKSSWRNFKRNSRKILTYFPRELLKILWKNSCRIFRLNFWGYCRKNSVRIPRENSGRIFGRTSDTFPGRSFGNMSNGTSWRLSGGTTGKFSGRMRQGNGRISRRIWWNSQYNFQWNPLSNSRWNSKTNWQWNTWRNFRWSSRITSQWNS